MPNRLLKPVLGLLAAGCAVASLHAQMAQDPLLSRTAAVEPNIVLMFDDSGSMVATAIYQYGGVASGMGMTGPNNDAVFCGWSICSTWTSPPTTFYGRSPDVNLIYYDPRITYSRRINADGTFQAAGATGGITSFNTYFYKATTAYSVQSATVTTKGAGYPSSGVTAIFSAAPAGGVTATGTVTTTSTLGVNSVTVNNAGSGYALTGVTATFSAPPAGGVRTTGTVGIGSSGRVGSVSVDNAGSGYPASGVTAAFTAAPSGGVTATGTVNMLLGTVSSVTVTAGGSGYGNSTNVTFSAPPAGGVRATGTMTRGTSGAGRPIISISISNPGSGYLTAPTITLSNTNGGSGATFTTAITNRISGVTVTNAGSGYTTTPAITLGGVGSGSGATFSTSLSIGVTGITITDPGSGYTSAPTITLSSTGGGTGATFTVVTGTTNVVSGITITNAGSGYVTTPTLTLGNTGTGFGATFTVNTNLVTLATPINRRWAGENTPTALTNYFNPSYTPDAGSPLATGATVIAYPNTASSATASYPKFRNRTDCSSSTSCTWAEELQNYANWKTYHSTRLDLAKTGIGLAFQPLNPTFRLGWGTINKLNSSSQLASGVRLYDSTTQSNFLTWLYAIVDDGGTPNRVALNKVGQYFQRADDGGPWATTPPLAVPADVTSTAAENTGHASCRRSYALLMTDGYYNDSFSSVGDVDTSTAASITSPSNYTYTGTIGPYADTANGLTKYSNSFADVAMKYWVTDLRPNIKNSVKTLSTDDAFWQHMNFYAIGLGVTGTLDATDGEVLKRLTGDTSTPPFRTLNWPTPAAEARESIDDMWHATINGRGKLLNAKNATDLNDSVTQMMAEVSGNEGTQSGVAVSTASLTQGTKKYTPSYTPVTWNGNLTAYNLDATSGNQIGVAWQVETLVSTNPTTGAKTYSSIIPAHASRNIFVGNGATTGTRAVPFTYSAMGTAGLTSTMNGTVNSNLIDYLRGDATNEDSLTTTASTTAIYRPRTTRLGDIVNSTPVFVKDTLDLNYNLLPSSTPGQSTYRAFVDGAGSPLAGGKKQRAEGVLFVGANDGMLHAFRDGTFDATTGAVVNPGGIETFAYVPKALLPTLNQLADKTYVHRYYVDGPNIETDAYFTTGTPRWANVVLGTTGAGAGVAAAAGTSPRTAVFAIDVTGLNSSPTSLNASNVLWEVSSSDSNFSELGYVLTDVQAGTTIGGDWVAIFGNGYDSKSCKAMLYVVNLETGARIREIDTGAGNCSTAKNGLGGVRVVRNANQQIIGVYAGDLQGNLWKFNLNNSSSASWGVDLGGAALFTGGATQPITAAPAVLALSSTMSPKTGYMVVAGTGKFFEISDITTTTQQSLYGIWDPLAFGAASIPAGTALTDKTLLIQQTIGSAQVDASGNTYFAVSTNAVDYVGTTSPFLAARRGWYINYPNSGQRLVYPLDLLSDRFAVADTISPSNVSLDPCSQANGGTGYLYLVDALTGAGPTLAIFDTNGDGNIDSTDLVVSGLEAKADGRNVSLLGDKNAARTTYVNVSGGSPGGTKISISCVLTGTCISTGGGVTPKFKSREWRQLFMR